MLPPTPTLSDELQKLHAKASKGDTNAQFQLGLLFASGNILPKDTESAIYWFRKAAVRGHGQAQFYWMFLILREKFSRLFRRGDTG